ncbi:MAG: ComEC/Rec2 family competence protein [Rhizobiaceae bacterium]
MGEETENAGTGKSEGVTRQDTLPDDRLRPVFPEPLPIKKTFGALFGQHPKWFVTLNYRVSQYYLNGAATLHNMMLKEGDQRTLFNWLPVFFGTGVFIYFKAFTEPMLLALVMSAAFFLVLVWRQKLHGRSFFILMALAMMFCGMAMSKIRVLSVSAPIIERQITTKISGLVLSVSKNSRGAPRYLIRPIEAEEIETINLPRKIRLSAASKHGPVLPGQVISGLARIYPFSGPAYPGGYDFSFYAWFKEIGGTGFFMGKPKLMDISVNLTFSDEISLEINQVRSSIEKRLHRAMPGEAGDIAVALITGNRSGLDKKTQDSLRKSGLAHILAISGLHMALVTLTIVWLVRAVLALIPFLVLRYPAHKWAAFAGFVAASSYLTISGASIATQRAWIMISVMLLSTLMDRRAITMRSVAIAALLILALAPDSLLSPGFQMSFAAVSALVASYEALRKWRERRPKNYTANSRTISLVGSLGSYVAGLGFSSLIAGGATALFAAYHFHQVAPMGLFANLGALPIVSLAVMPLALFSILLMPYGLEGLVLTPLATAIYWVVDVSDWINSFGVPGVTGMLPTGFLALGIASLLMLTLLKTQLRLFGLVSLMAIPFLSGSPRPPDIIVAETGRAIAVMNGEGSLELLYPRRNKFITDIWKKAWPVFVDSKKASKNPECNKDQCIKLLKNGAKLYVVYKPAMLKPACENADILIAPRLWWVNCRSRTPGLILKRHDFEQFGTHTIHFTDGDANSKQYRIKRALPDMSRPWNRWVPEKL